jgi:hypothetical protein
MMKNTTTATQTPRTDSTAEMKPFALRQASDSDPAEYITISADDYNAKLEELGAIKWKLKQAEERQQSEAPAATQPRLRLAEYSLPAWRGFAEGILSGLTVADFLHHYESSGGDMNPLFASWLGVPVSRLFEITPSEGWPMVLNTIERHIEVFTYCENTDGEHCDYECSDNERRPQHKATVELVWLP